MQERWITGVAVLALTLIPAAALASAPTSDATKREAAHPAPVHHAAPIHQSAKAEPEHAPERRVVAYHPKYEHTQLKASKAVYYSHWESCVPFARATSGIMLKGNAANWWSAASGVYSRGQQPEPGSVLNFRATGRMRLGHVSVVTRVINSREIEVDHANWWGPGANKSGISRNVPVIDVSPANDWTEVRVGLGAPGSFGSVYPTYGFIYDRPDNGVVLANARTAAPSPRTVEVAEAPDAAPIASQPLHHSLLDFSGGR
jgi:surface antigen